ncbi:MAG: LPS export ABC transporter periplasmic protein LptC [Lautropia sp.]|nr:LPS export ABC transporter periplasmic protein LptC [Lautropia sp.]
MSPRLFDRLAATASMLILIGLGMASYYFAQQAERQNQKAPPQAGRADPDYFVERMALMRADATGAPSVRIEARQMLHYPLDQQIAFTAPRIITLDDQHPLLTVQAERGKAADNGDEAELFDNVQVLRAATARDPALRVDTQAVTVDLVGKIIHTDQPVVVTSGNNRLSGVGLAIQEQSRLLTFQSRVQGHFPAPDPRTGTGATTSTSTNTPNAKP